MKKQKLTFDELAKKAIQLDKNDQTKVVGGRRNRGSRGETSNFGWGRGGSGIIDDDLVIRLSSGLQIKR